jgi:hypothetical protein
MLDERTHFDDFDPAVHLKPQQTVPAVIESLVVNPSIVHVNECKQHGVNEA